MAQKLKPRSDGRFSRNITDPKTKKRVYFYADSERELNRKILAYERKRELGRTFAEVADEWWGDVYSTFAHQTLKGYKPAYARTVKEFGDMYIDTIQPRDILAYYKTLVKLEFTHKTISNHRIILNQIFDHAVVESDIQFNPCSSVKLPKTSTKSKVRDPASPDDEQRILTSDHKWIFPLVALLTGLRKGEILALQWRDVDFDENVISVTKSVEHVGKRPQIKPPKTESGTRDVPLLLFLKGRLLTLKAATDPKPEAYIFSSNGGVTPLDENKYERLYRSYCAEVGISCTAHQLRHSYATIAVEEDVNPKDLQNALGHADISTTMNVYAAARKRSVEKVSAKLNAKYSGSKN